MATVNCNLSQLNTLSACFNCESQTERQALMVYYLNQRLISLGGANQTAAQLRAQVQSVWKTAIDTVADNLDVQVAKAGAIAAGSALVSGQTIAQARAAANPFSKMSLAELRGIEVLLRCLLNAYP